MGSNSVEISGIIPKVLSEGLVRLSAFPIDYWSGMLCCTPGHVPAPPFGQGTFNSCTQWRGVYSLRQNPRCVVCLLFARGKCHHGGARGPPDTCESPMLYTLGAAMQDSGGLHAAAHPFLPSREEIIPPAVPSQMTFYCCLVSFSSWYERLREVEGREEDGTVTFTPEQSKNL